MSHAIEWTAPPRSPAQIRDADRRERLRAIAADLSKRPGEWALIFRALPHTEEAHDEHLKGATMFGIWWTCDSTPYGPTPGDPGHWEGGTVDVYAYYDRRFDHYSAA